MIWAPGFLIGAGGEEPLSQQDPVARPKTLALRWLWLHFCCPAEQFGVVVGGLGPGANLRVEHLGVLADEDPPGPGSHSVEDDRRRAGRAERRLVPEVGHHPREHLAQVI